MDEIVYRMALSDEGAKIRTFLREHKHSDFSAAVSPEFFDFLYRDDKGNIHFAIAERNDEILAILGLLRYSDPNNELPDTSLTLWHSNDPSGMAGLKLLQFVLNQGDRSYSSVGVRKEVLGFYKMLKVSSGKMDHHFVLNKQRKNFAIFDGDLSSIPDFVASPLPKEFSITEVDEFAPLKFQGDAHLIKSADYLTHRYLDHPIYDYRILALNQGSNIVGYSVFRIATANDSRVIRWVDWIGQDEHLVHFATYLHNILVQEDCEYFDFYSANLPEHLLSEIGFLCRDKYKAIVPNFFEPFLAENEDKYFVSTLPDAYLFKGDSDADRPFRLEY